LGIDKDYQLNFDKHIKNICHKASQQLSVLKRIGCFLSKLNKLTILVKIGNFSKNHQVGHSIKQQLYI
jgi:hypothetical protein